MWVIVGLAVVGVALAGIAAVSSREAVQIVKDIRKEPTLGTIKSSYTDNIGVLREVVTTQLPGESDDQHVARHASLFAAMLKQFPKG